MLELKNICKTFNPGTINAKTALDVYKRQAQGNGDSAVTVFGMIVGAALAHNFGLAGNPDSKNEAGQLVVGGISTAGKVAVIVGLVVLLVIAMWNMPKKETTK